MRVKAQHRVHLHQWVNLKRYPLNNYNHPLRQQLIHNCQRELELVGYTVIPGLFTCKQVGGQCLDQQVSELLQHHSLSGFITACMGSYAVQHPSWEASVSSDTGDLLLRYLPSPACNDMAYSGRQSDRTSYAMADVGVNMS